MPARERAAAAAALLAGAWLATAAWGWEGTAGAAAPAPDTSAARTARPWAACGVWSVGVGGAVAALAAGDVNRLVRRDNLAFASAVDPFAAGAEVSGDVCYRLSRRLSLEGRFGYLWREHADGRFSRRLSAKSATLGLACHPLARARLRAGVVVAAGVLLDASVTGEDPLGGIGFSSSGGVLEAGLEAEYSVSRAVALGLRCLARRAVARGALPEGGDIDLSGILGRGALRVYFRR